MLSNYACVCCWNLTWKQISKSDEEVQTEEVLEDKEDKTKVGPGTDKMKIIEGIDVGGIHTKE